MFLYIIQYIKYYLVKNKMSLLTDVYGHVGHQILDEEEKNRRRNNALAYYPKE